MHIQSSFATPLQSLLFLLQELILLKDENVINAITKNFMNTYLEEKYKSVFEITLPISLAIDKKINNEQITELY